MSNTYVEPYTECVNEDSTPPPYPGNNQLDTEVSRYKKGIYTLVKDDILYFSLIILLYNKVYLTGK